MTERENLMLVFNGQTPAWLPEASRSMAWIGKFTMDLERPHMEEGYDWFRVHWLPQNALGGIVTHPDINQSPPLDDITCWKEQICFPDLDALDWEALKSDVEKELEGLDGRLPFFMLEHGAFERLTLLMGYEEGLVSLITEPEACREYAEAMADFKIALFDRVYALAPYELVIYQDDLGTGTGPLISVGTYREIFKEPLRRVVEHVHAAGCLFGYHSCGCMEAFMDDLLDVGIDMINPVQTCNNQMSFKAKYGNRVVIHGGINNQEITDCPYPEESAVRAELRRAVDTLAPGGRFILEIRRQKMAANGLDVPAILHDEFDRYTAGYYQKLIE